jgi:hypothetical protein
MPIEVKAKLVLNPRIFFLKYFDLLSFETERHLIVSGGQDISGRLTFPFPQQREDDS